MPIKCEFCHKEVSDLHELDMRNGFVIMCGECAAKITNRPNQPRPQVPKPSNN